MNFNDLDDLKGLDRFGVNPIFTHHWPEKATGEKTFAHVAQSVEHVLGKDEVTGSNPVVGYNLKAFTRTSGSVHL